MLMDTKDDADAGSNDLPLNLGDPLVLPRTKLITKILATSNRLLITAPPGAAKSCLALLLRTKLESQGVSVFSRTIANPSPASLKRMHKTPRIWLNELFGEDFEHTLRRHAVILLDDAQGLFSVPDIWNFLMKSCEPVKIIFFASTLPESCDQSTLAISSQLGWNDLKLDKEEQDELCAKLTARYSTLTWFPETLAMVRRDAGGHVGLLRLIPEQLVNNHPRDIKNDVEFVAFMHRFYFGANLFETWPMHRFLLRVNERLNSTHQEILNEVIVRGGVTAPQPRDPFSPPDTLYVKSKRELLSMAIVTQVGPNLEFATPFHFRCFSRAALPAAIISEAEFQKKVPNLPSWCAFVISRFQQSTFRGDGGHDIPLEDAMQHLFWKAAAECTPSSYGLTAQVSKTFGWGETAKEEEAKGKEERRLDFWVNSKLHWAIELARDGDRQQEHLERFGADGKYFTLKPKAWCVIDFRRPGTDIPQLEGKPNLISVVFSDNFSSATLVIGADKTQLRVDLLS